MELANKALSEFAIQNGLCVSVNPLGTNKEWDHGYLSKVYQPILDQKRIMSVLEIGLMWGSSLQLWWKFLEPELCVGIDNGNAVNQLEFEQDTRAPILIKGDAFKREIYGNLNANFDLIIDDANHTAYQQSKSTSIFLRKLNEKGFMIVEDISPGSRYMKNILRSVPPFLTVQVFQCDLSELPGKLPNSICVIFRVAKSKDQFDTFRTPPFWRKLEVTPRILRIFPYLTQIGVIRPCLRIFSYLRHKFLMFHSSFSRG